MENNNILQSVKNDVDTLLAGRGQRLIQMGANEKQNYINRVAQKYGVDQLSTHDEDVYMECYRYLDAKLKQQTMIESVLNESNIDDMLNESISLPQSIGIMRYEDSDVVRVIRQVMREDFKNFTLERIAGDEGGAFFNLEISGETEDDIRDDLELKRFYLAQVMSNFKAQFFASVSAILPLINVRVAPYAFTKNSNKIRFALTLCLSHTNDREWVSGVYKTLDDKEKEKKIEDDREVMSEAPGHAVKAMRLKVAIQGFKDGSYNKKVLDTAIKACSRGELETYVLRSLGLSAPEPNDQKSEMTEAPLSAMFNKIYVQFADSDGFDIFDVANLLRAQGMQVNAVTASKISVKYASKKFSDETILGMLAQKFPNNPATIVNE